MLSIQTFNDSLDKKNAELQDLRVRNEKFKGEIDDLRNKDIPNTVSKIEERQNKIDEIKIESRVESLGQYREKFDRKQHIEGLVNEQGSVLKSHFGAERSNVTENIPYWEHELGMLAQYKDKAKDVMYDDNEITKLQNKKAELEKRRTEISARMKQFLGKMKEVEREINEVLPFESEYLNCETSVDLVAIRKRLQQFKSVNEETKDVALEAIEIFGTIETEEKERVAQLFGRESIVSSYTNEITEGLYQQVLYNAEEGKIEVERKDGAFLPPEKLSGGSYDQLYFAIRLALGRKLLEDKRGFFIMDDPFVKADSNRLLRQFEVLKKIVELGWQIIYFSAKDEVRDALKEDIDHGDVKYVEVQSPF